MKKTFVNLVIVISGIYCMGDILFGFPNDSFLMHDVTNILSTIFSCTLLCYFLKILDNNNNREN